MGTEAHEFDATVRNTLVRNTPVILESFNAEVEYAIESCIGRCEREWTPIRVRDKVSRVVSLMSGRAFVGLPLSRDPAWVEATTNYTQDVSRAYLYVRALPWFIKAFVIPFSPAVNSLKRHKRINVEKMGPLLAAKQSKEASKGSSEPGGEVLDWFMSHYDKPPTSQQLARDQLLITFASIYNLSNALSYLVFDLAAYPEYIPELRAELKEVLGDKGVIDKHALPKLRKLDSFLRESQRLSPPSIGNTTFLTSPPYKSLTQFLQSKHTPLRRRPKRLQNLHRPPNPRRAHSNGPRLPHKQQQRPLALARKIRPLPLLAAPRPAGQRNEVPAQQHGRRQHQLRPWDLGLPGQVFRFGGVEGLFGFFDHPL